MPTLTPADVAADWVVFDNTQTVTLYPFDADTETFGAGAAVTGLKVQTGESFGLSVADSGASDGGQLDGTFTLWLLKTVGVKKYDKLVDAAGVVYVVEVATRKAMDTHSECQCRSGVQP